MVVQDVTKSFNKLKAKIKHSLNTLFLKRIQNLKGILNMTTSQFKDYTYCKKRYDDISQDKIRGHEIRTNAQLKYELNEPNIDTYSKFKKRYQPKIIFISWKMKTDRFTSSPNSLLSTAEKYCIQLSAKSKTNIV